MAFIQQKDTSFTKIFVGGLPYHTTDATLKEFFDQFGEIEEAVVITDRQTGKSRGYGFVTMADQPAAERACKEPNPVIDGRKANVNLAYLGAKPRGIQTAALPLAIKANYPASALLQGQYGLPAQYMYPQALMAASPSAAVLPGGMASAQSPLSPAAAAQYLDYSAYANQFANGYIDPAAYPGLAGATTAGYVAASQAAAYHQYAVPHPLTSSSAAALAAYQTQLQTDHLQ